MRLVVASLLALGTFWILFGVMFASIGGPCRVADCGPSLNLVSFWLGVALFATGALIAAFRTIRSVRRADRDDSLRR